MMRNPQHPHLTRKERAELRRQSEESGQQTVGVPKSSGGIYVVRYVRGAGIISLVLALVAFMVGPDFFWEVVVLGYLVAILIAVDVYTEDWPANWLRWTGIGLIVAASAAFSVMFVFVPASLGVDGQYFSYDYLPGTLVTGISGDRSSPNWIYISAATKTWTIAKKT